MDSFSLVFYINDYLVVITAGIVGRLGKGVTLGLFEVVGPGPGRLVLVTGRLLLLLLG